MRILLVVSPAASCTTSRLHVPTPTCTLLCPLGEGRRAAGWQVRGRETTERLAQANSDSGMPKTSVRTSTNNPPAPGDAPADTLCEGWRRCPVISTSARFPCTSGMHVPHARAATLVASIHRRCAMAASDVNHARLFHDAIEIRLHTNAACGRPPGVIPRNAGGSRCGGAACCNHLAVSRPLCRARAAGRPPCRNPARMRANVCFLPGRGHGPIAEWPAVELPTATWCSYASRATSTKTPRSVKLRSRHSICTLRVASTNRASATSAQRGGPPAAKGAAEVASLGCVSKSAGACQRRGCALSRPGAVGAAMRHRREDGVVRRPLRWRRRKELRRHGGAAANPSPLAPSFHG